MEESKLSGFLKRLDANRAVDVDKRLQVLKAIEDGAQEVPTRMLAEKYLQNPKSLSIHAIDTLFRLLKIPASYARRVPDPLLKDMVENGLNTREIETKKANCWFFEADNTVHLISDIQPPKIADTLREINNDGLLKTLNGNPLEGTYRAVIKVGDDLEVESGTPVYPMANIIFNTASIAPTTASTGIYRQICSNGMVRSVRDGVSLKISPGQLNSDRFQTVLAAVIEACRKEASLFAKGIKTAQGIIVPDPVKLLAEAVDSKRLSKSLAISAGGIISTLPIEDRPEIPQNVSSLWDLVNVLTYSAQAFNVRSRVGMESQIYDFLSDNVKMAA